MTLRSTSARATQQWVGLAETDLWEKIVEIILKAADAGKSSCKIGCLTNKEVIKDLIKLGFDVIEVYDSDGQWAQVSW